MEQGTAIPLGGEQVHCEASQRKLAAAVFRMALEDLRVSYRNNRRSALQFLSFWCQRLEVDPEAFETVVQPRS